MSHVIPIAKVNQFLPNEKLSLDVTIDVGTGLPVDHALIADLEETGRDIVHGRIAATYDTTLWVDPASTPTLVTNIVGMMVAGWVYDRQFSEEAATGDSYGQRRLLEAYALLEAVVDGTYVLDDVTPVVDGTATGEPSVLESEPVFVMGEPF